MAAEVWCGTLWNLLCVLQTPHIYGQADHLELLVDLEDLILLDELVLRVLGCFSFLYMLHNFWIHWGAILMVGGVLSGKW